jgi:hypothetical protein
MKRFAMLSANGPVLSFTIKERDENEPGKSDCCFGERRGYSIGWLGNLRTTASNVIIRHAERRRAPVSTMAAFYRRRSADSAIVSHQVHGVLDPAVTVFTIISEISC